MSDETNEAESTTADVQAEAGAAPSLFRGWPAADLDSVDADVREPIERLLRFTEAHSLRIRPGKQPVCTGGAVSIRIRPEHGRADAMASGWARLVELAPSFGLQAIAPADGDVYGALAAAPAQAEAEGEATISDEAPRRSRSRRQVEG